MERADYLIVGAGLFGCVFAQKAVAAGKKVLVIDRRNHIGGNIYTREVNGITVHEYGAHIFHTSDKEVWEYVNAYTECNHYINSPVALYEKELYNLPFNMNTFSRMWNITTPAEAAAIIEKQRQEAGITEPKNLEEQALALAGRDIYEKLIKGYTEKQWGRPCSELPAFIIRRIPLRFTFDNNYFNDPYQGIPKEGYTALAQRLLSGCTVLTNTDYRQFIAENPDAAACTVYTGMIDEYFGCRFGRLQYRSLRFETEELPDCDNFQGNAVVNYTSASVPWTRIIEHKHFAFGTGKGTIITREYPREWEEGAEPFYPVNDEKNTALYEKYAELAGQEKNVIFGGRLGCYRYYDMDKVIRAAFDAAEQAGLA